jgi:hypothetical protein
LPGLDQRGAAANNFNQSLEILMSVNCVSSVSNANSQVAQTNGISPARQLKQDFDTLAKALGSGDLAGAQQAFTTFQQDLKNIPQSQGVQQTSQVSPSNPRDALAVLSQALGSGNLSDAQNAFSTLLQDLQGQAGPVKHHHHHHGGGAQPVAATATATTTSAAPATTAVNTTA